MLKADLHTHTLYSPDSVMSLEDIISRCLEVGINCLAITDHNTIEGALRMEKASPFHIIIGEEIQTRSGEVIGLFLEEEIPRGLSAEEAVSGIKAQGGLVMIPHPFDRTRPSAIRRQTLEELLPQIDIIETFNSRTIFLRDSERARLFAKNHGLPSGAGSDAHTIGEIGNAYVEMAEFNGKEEFLNALSKGDVIGRRSNPLVHIASSWTRLRKRLL